LNFRKFPPRVPRIIGLTGGISTGKSTVSRYLAQHHSLPIFDADIYARQAVQPGSLALVQIVDRYGSHLLLADGTLDRSQLAEIIFQQTAEKSWLESIIHPYVRECFDHDIQQATSATVVAVIPLLFEAQLQDTVTEVWVVACEPAQQMARLQQRDGLSLEQAQARIASQMSLTEKIKLADVVLDNSGKEAELLAQIDRRLIVTA
jgi:dephospho-CoA kinase